MKAISIGAGVVSATGQLRLMCNHRHYCCCCCCCLSLPQLGMASENWQQRDFVAPARQTCNQIPSDEALEESSSPLLAMTTTPILPARLAGRRFIAAIRMAKGSFNADRGLLPPLVKWWAQFLRPSRKLTGNSSVNFRTKHKQCRPFNMTTTTTLHLTAVAQERIYATQTHAANNWPVGM